MSHLSFYVRFGEKHWRNSAFWHLLTSNNLFHFQTFILLTGSTHQFRNYEYWISQNCFDQSDCFRWQILKARRYFHISVTKKKGGTKMWRPFEFKPPLLVWKISNESLELKLLNLGENTEGIRGFRHLLTTTIYFHFQSFILNAHHIQKPIPKERILIF